MSQNRERHAPRLEVLDALRALAVAGVFCVHFPGLVIGDFVDTGALGVRLFFVLSGFLITGIILRERDRIDGGGLRLLPALRSFYLRRLFRIAPAFYLALAAAWVVSLDDIRVSWPWHAAFLSNQYIIEIGRWPGSLSHLWTLALEFQFYLVWPVALFLLPRRVFPWLIGTCLVLGPLARWAAPAWGVPTDFAHLTTAGSLDFFGWGASVAWMRNSARDRVRGMETIAARLLPWLLAAAFLLAGRWPWTLPMNVVHAGAGFVMAAASAALIATCTRTAPPSWAGWLARRNLLVYLGAMSYGLYLYHNLMHWVAPRACLRLFGNSYPEQPLLYTAVLLASTLAVSAASWHFLESPLNRYSRRHTTTA